MTTIIDTKTKEYIKVLADTDEVKAYTKAVEEFKRDSDAKKLLTDFQEAQRTYAVFKQGGFAGVEDQEKKARDLQGKVTKNKTIQSLIETQEALQALVGGLADEISQGINFPFTQPQRGGCCG